MKQKHKKVIPRAMAILLLGFMLIFLPVMTVRAALIGWNSLIDATGFYSDSKTYSMRDINTYSSLQTTNDDSMTGGYSGRFFDNMRHNSDGSRVTYTKKLYVKGHVGSSIAIVAANNDTAEVGGSSLLGTNRFYYNVMEYDSNGYSLYDPAWRSMSEPYVLGKTTSSNGVYAYGVDQAKRERDLAYVVIIYRWDNGDSALGSGTQFITGYQIYSSYPILCIANKPFNYTFNLNGGNINGRTTNPTVSRFGISDAIVPTEPTRNGYTFNGWKITSQGGKQKEKVYTTDQLNTMFTDTKYYSSLFEDATFEAQWTPNNYTINTYDYYWQGNDWHCFYSMSETKYYGDTYNIVAGNSPNGYHYGDNPNWSTDGHKTGSDTKSFTVTNNTDIHRHYYPNTYYVSYNGNGATSNVPETTSFLYNEGDHISSQVPIREGYTFIDWDYSGNKFSPGDAIPNDWGSFELTAEWTPKKYTVAFDYKDGSGKIVSAKQDYWTTLGNANRNLEDNCFNNPKGHNDWDSNNCTYSRLSDATLSGTVTRIECNNSYNRDWRGCFFNGSDLVTGKTYTITIRAKGVGNWKIGHERGGIKIVGLTSEYQTYQWTFIANDNQSREFIVYTTGTTNNAYIQFEDPILQEGESNLIIPIRPGYEFKGWYNASFGGVKVKPSQIVTGNVTVYAHWTPNPDTPYTVNHYKQNIYSDNYILAETENKTGTTDTKVTPSVKTYTGFTSPSKVTVNIDGDGSRVVNYYYTRNSYKISLTSGVGISSVSGSGTYRYQATVNINAVVKPGYTWKNWTGRFTFRTKNYRITMPTNDVSLTANATPNTNTKYTVKHWQQNIGGTASSHDASNYTLKDTDNLTGTTDTNVTPNVKTYAGFTSPSTQTVNIDGDGNRVVNYYYTRNSYKITLTSGVGISSVSGSGTYQYGANISIDAVVKPGYTWKNWTGTTTYTTINQSFTMPSNNVTLTANATPNTNTPYNVKYFTQNLDGSTYTQYGATVTKTGTTDTVINTSNHIISIDGFTYKEAKSGSTVVTSFTVLGDGSVCIDYYYTRNSYNVSLTSGIGISGVTGAGSYKYGATVNINATVKPGYTWKNWTGTFTSTTKNYKETMPANDVNMTANATPNIYTVTFDGNKPSNATSTPNVNPTSKQVTFDSAYGTLADASLMGYTFKGWNTQADGNGTTVKETDYYRVVGNQTLYAIWSANTDTKYTVKHYQQNIYDDNYTLVLTENFVGTTDENVTPNVKSYIGFISPTTQTVRVEADGSRIVEYYYVRKTYNLTIEHYRMNTTGNYENKTTASEQSISYRYGTEITLSDYQRTDSEFKVAGGISYSHAEVGESKDRVIKYTVVDVNSTLKLFYERHKYTVTYDGYTNGGLLNTGSRSTGVEFYYEQEIDLNRYSGIKSTYTFVGWSTDKDAHVKLSKLSMNVSNITIYAIYSKEITLNQTDSQGTRSDYITAFNNQQTVVFSAKDIRTYNGWRVTGWSNLDTGNNHTVNYNSNDNIEVRVTSSEYNIYAIYDRDLTLKFNANSGKYSDNTTLKRDSKVQWTNSYSIRSTFNPTFNVIEYPVRKVDNSYELKGNSGNDNYECTGYYISGNSTKYVANGTIEIANDTELLAYWNKYPIIVNNDTSNYTRKMYTGQYVADNMLLYGISTEDDYTNNINNLHITKVEVMKGNKVLKEYTSQSYIDGYQCWFNVKNSGDADSYVVYVECTDNGVGYANSSDDKLTTSFKYSGKIVNNTPAVIHTVAKYIKAGSDSDNIQSLLSTNDSEDIRKYVISKILDGQSVTDNEDSNNRLSRWWGNEAAIKLTNTLDVSSIQYNGSNIECNDLLQMIDNVTTSTRQINIIISAKDQFNADNSRVCASIILYILNPDDDMANYKSNTRQVIRYLPNSLGEYNSTFLQQIMNRYEMTSSLANVVTESFNNKETGVYGKSEDYSSNVSIISH